MCRVHDLARPPAAGEQGELFPVWRCHPFFTGNPAPALVAEREHRHHAAVEQVIADSKASALAHLPSGHFNANAAWLTLRAMTYNLLRATGALASAFHARATTATLRATWSASRSGSPAPHGASPSAFRATGAGNTPGHTCPTPSTRTRLTASARPARHGPTGTETAEELGRPADTARPRPPADPKPAQKPIRRSLPDHIGGSRLRRSGWNDGGLVSSRLR